MFRDARFFRPARKNLGRWVGGLVGAGPVLCVLMRGLRMGPGASCADVPAVASSSCYLLCIARRCPARSLKSVLEEAQK